MLGRVWMARQPPSIVDLPALRRSGFEAERLFRTSSKDYNPKSNDINMGWLH